MITIMLKARKISSPLNAKAIDYIAGDGSDVGMESINGCTGTDYTLEPAKIIHILSSYKGMPPLESALRESTCGFSSDN
jgi:hypothetical protein